MRPVWSGGEGRGDSEPLGVALPRQRRGRCAEQAQKPGDCDGDLPAFRQSAENRGNCAADVSAVRGLGNVNAVGGQSARSTRQGRPAGKLLFALLLPEASGGDIPGHLRPWGHDAEALIFPRRRSAFAAESRPRRGGRRVKAGAERAETRRTRSAVLRVALLRRGAGAFGGEVAPEHACRGQRIGALRKSAAARRERGAFSAGRVSPEGGRPAEG